MIRCACLRVRSASRCVRSFRRSISSRSASFSPFPSAAICGPPDVRFRGSGPGPLFECLPSLCRFLHLPHPVLQVRRYVLEPVLPDQFLALVEHVLRLLHRRLDLAHLAHEPDCLRDLCQYAQESHVVTPLSFCPSRTACPQWSPPSVPLPPPTPH